MNTPANYVGQPIRSLQTMLRTIAHVDETLLKLVPTSEKGYAGILDCKTNCRTYSWY